MGDSMPICGAQVNGARGSGWMRSGGERERWSVGYTGPMPELPEVETIARGLDKRLAGRDYVADACSIADFAILGWAWRHERHLVDLADFPNVKRWYETMMARPATQRGFEVALS